MKIWDSEVGYYGVSVDTVRFYLSLPSGGSPHYYTFYKHGTHHFRCEGCLCRNPRSMPHFFSSEILRVYCHVCFARFFPEELRAMRDNVVLKIKASQFRRICNACGCRPADFLFTVLGYNGRATFCESCLWEANCVDNYWKPSCEIVKTFALRDELFHEVSGKTFAPRCECGATGRWLGSGNVSYCDGCLENYHILQVMAS